MLVSNYNDTIHRSHGQKPNFLHKGITINRPESIIKPNTPRFTHQHDFLQHFQEQLKTARENASKVLEKYYENFHQYYNKKNESKPHTFYPRQWILAKNNARKGKISDTFIGPAEIDAVSEHTALVTFVNNGIKKRINIGQIIPYFYRDGKDFTRNYTGPVRQGNIHTKQTDVALEDPYSAEVERGMKVLATTPTPGLQIEEDDDDGIEQVYDEVTQKVNKPSKTVRFTI